MKGKTIPRARAFKARMLGAGKGWFLSTKNISRQPRRLRFWRGPPGSFKDQGRIPSSSVLEGIHFSPGRTCTRSCTARIVPTKGAHQTTYPAHAATKTKKGLGTKHRHLFGWPSATRWPKSRWTFLCRDSILAPPRIVARSRAIPRPGTARGELRGIQEWLQLSTSSQPMTAGPGAVPRGMDPFSFSPMKLGKNTPFAGMKGARGPKFTHLGARRYYD